MAFRFPISPRSRRTLNDHAALAWTFQKADNPARARIILDAARTLRDGIGVENARQSYNDAYLYRVIPEIARRLDPGVEILPEEVEKDGEQPLPERLMRNLSNEGLALFAYQCHRFADYRGQFRAMVEEIRDVDAMDRPEIRAVAEALEMLTCHDVHGNYAIHAMLGLDPEATQRAVKTLPGHYGGVNTKINLRREPEEEQKLVWCLVSAGYAYESMIAESEDQKVIEDLYDIHIRAWSDPESWKDPERVRSDREKELLGDGKGAFSRRSGNLPNDDDGRHASVAVQIEHLEMGVQKRFFIDQPLQNAMLELADEDEGPQP